MFIPDPGYTIIDADLEKADAQIVAWEANDETLKEIFRDKTLNLHVENAKMIFGLKHVDKSDDPTSPYHKAKQGVHLCLTEDHEVLTEQGWVQITDKPRSILCWSINYNALSFESVKEWFDEVVSTKFYDVDKYAFSQKMTHNHSLPYSYDGKTFNIRKVQDLHECVRLPKSGNYIGGKSDITEIEARLLCAIQADGHRSKLRYRFHLKKKRKIQRLHKLLNKLEIEYSYSEYDDGTTNTSFRYPLIPKQLDNYILTFSAKSLAAYVNEAPFWDGSTGNTGRKDLGTMHKSHAYWFATMVHLTGKASQVIKTNGFYRASINNRPLFRWVVPECTQEKRRVLCPVTPTGFFMVRRNGVISITGNTDYGGRPRRLAEVLGITVYEAELFQKRWFGAHPKILSWHKRVQIELQQYRKVKNKFGFERFYFDRIQSIFSEALAWVPQSSVGIVTNKGLLNIENNMSEAQLLLQNHDSLVLQVPTELTPNIYQTIHQNMLIPIPYHDPLTIPVSMAASEISWGDCEPVEV